MKSVSQIYNLVIESLLIENIKDDTIELFGNTEEAKSYVTKFFDVIRHKEQSSLKKDIQYWVKQGFEEFKKYVDEFKSNKERKSSLNNLTQVDNKNGRLLDIIDGYEIWRVDSYKAAKFLGRTYKNVSTNWCISSNDAELWPEYYFSEMNNFYFLIKQEPIRNNEELKKWNKVGIKVSPDNTLTFWDSTNNIDNKKIEKKLDKLPQNIQDIVQKYHNKLSGSWWYEYYSQPIVEDSKLEKDWLFAKAYALAHKSDRATLQHLDTLSTVTFVETPVGIFILSIDTPEENRGKGGATFLLQQLKKTEQDIYLESDASEDNKQDELEALYIRNGFNRINDKKFYYDAT